MLSGSSSFMATYCCDFIPMGGSAEERIAAPSAGGLGLGNRDMRAGLTVLLVTAAALAAERPTENIGSLESEAGSGIAPRGVVMGPEWETKPPG